MSEARDAILKRLRARQPIPTGSGKAQNLPVDPLPDASPTVLEARFIDEAVKAGITVLPAANDAEAYAHLTEIVGEAHDILGWAAEHIPLAGYGAWLAEAGISVSQEPDDDAKIGITGVDAALSTTGSLILFSGAGKPRAASLLPEDHIAIVRRESITANLESWLAGQREAGINAVREASNVIIITGPSRTADIGMELVMGAHGPRRMFVILV